MMHWLEPVVAEGLPDERGPVMVVVDDRVDPARSAEFATVMRLLADERGRDGACAWGLFEDAADAGRFLEYFLVESWMQHMRQHARVSQSAVELQARAREYRVDPGGPLLRHLLATSPRPAGHLNEGTAT